MFSEGTARGAIKDNIQALLAGRRSQRVFNNELLDEADVADILLAATTAPNSCNRHGIKMKVIDDRRDKELLSGVLVGGVGWIHRAQKIILFLADPVAYASPNEKDFMHYCDVGFMAMAMWLVAESKGIGVAYINPNVYWKAELEALSQGNYIFCGALVLGNYDMDKRAIASEPGKLTDMLIWSCPSFQL